MRIQMTTTRLDGTQHIVTQQVLPGQILRSRAVPGGITALELDGRPITGSTPVKGRAPLLQRQADDLLITVDDQTLVIIDDFFVTQGAALQGFDWDVSHAAGASQAESSTSADGAAADSAEGLGGGALVSSNAVYWALGAAGLVGGIAVAAGGGGGSSSSGSSAATPGQAAVSTTPLDGLVVAGPLIDGHSLTISFYRADGTLLAGPIPIDAAGRFVSSIDRSYTGSILAKVVDSSAGPDYLDEADNAPKDLVGELRAVFLSEQAEVISIVVSPMSELAVRLMGVADSGTATDGLSASQITNANEAVAARLGLQNNDLFGDVTPVVNASGAQVAAPDQAGLVLAALSGLERLHGVDDAMALLAHAIQADDNDVIAAMLISGLQEAGRNAPGSYADMWVAIAPQSSVAEALGAAGQLADAAIQAWTADDVAALTASTVAAMEPRQIALLSADAVQGFSPGQLQVLSSNDLAIAMETAQLTEAQSRALSPRALSLAIGGESPAIVITDDVGNAPETVGQTDGRAWSNDPLPVLSGRLPVQLPMVMQAALYNGDARLGTVEMGADHRAWTFTPAQPWRDGNYALNLRVQMPDGSTLPGSMSVDLTIDTIPAAITIDTPISTDDLISLSDRAAGLSLTGSAPDVAEGRDMRVSLGDESKVVQIRNGRWVADFAANEIPEGSGDIHVTIVTTDLAGNEATATHVVGLRTVAPVVQIDNSVAGDNRVNLREKELGVEVRGTVRNLADGQEVTVVWGGVSKTAVVANQAWAITFTSAEVPADGETQIRASAQDDAGNTSASVTQAVVVRTEGAWIDIGMVADDDIINQTEAAAPVTISGTTSLPAGSQLTVNWGAWQETVIVQDGNWAVDVPTANIPADATVVVTVTADDENGEVSSAKPLTIDRAGPGALSLTLVHDTGVSPNDGISSAGTFSVANQEGNARWQYSFDGGTTWQTGVATSFLVPPATYARGSIQVRQTDLAGNISAVTSNSDVYVIDAMAPTLAITASRAQLNGDQTSTLTFTFSEVVTGFDLAHIVAAKGSVSNLVMDVGNPSIYTATYTPGQGQVGGTESISVNQFADTAGNAASSYTSSNLFIVDTVAPTVAITSSKRSLKAGETAEIRFAFSEALALAPSLDDIAVQHGVLRNLRVDGADPKVYTATFTAAADLAQGSGSITLNAGAYADAVGNEGLASTLDDISIDTRAPTINGVTISGLTATDDPANRPLKTGDKIRVELAMSEPTTVRNGTPSFMIDVGGSAKTAGFVMASSGTNRLVFEYVVQTGDQDAAGGITSSANALQLHGAVLQDGFGNPVSSAVVPTVQAGQNAIAVDAIVTLLTQLAITSGTGMSTTWLNAGDVVTATATFNNVVNVQGVPQLSLRIGERSVAASYVAGTGSNQLTFSYTVMARDSDVDGISMPADALALNGGQINGLNGAPAMLALADVPANPGFLVDTTAPIAKSVVISGVTAAGQPASTDLGVGDKVRVDVTMSEPVSISPDAAYKIQLNLKTREASYVSGTGSAILTFEYVVAQGDAENHLGVTAWADALVLGDDGRFSDAAGNAASLVMPVVQDGANTVVVDTGPAVAEELIVTTRGGKSVASVGDTIHFMMFFNKFVNVSGRPELDFELNGVAKKAIAPSAWGTLAVDFDYVVQPGDEALANEIKVDPATAVNLVKGSSIRDNSGVDVDAKIDAFQFKARTESTPFVDGRVATIETVEILSVTGAEDLWLNAGDTVTVRVTFDREVELKRGNIDQEIRIGGRRLERAEAEPFEGPTRTIDFVHTIPASAIGQVNFPADSLRITNGGALATPGGNPAVLSHAAVGSSTLYSVDSIAPEVVSVWVAGLDSSGNPKSGDLVEGDKVQMQVQVSEIVEVTGVPTYTLTVGGTVVQAQYVRAEENRDTTLIFEYALGTDQTLANEFQLNAGALGLSAGVAMIRDRAGNDITRATPVIRYSAGKADLSAGGDDIATITAQQIAAIAPDRTYWVRLGDSDRLFAKNLGGVQYGRWQEDGVIYDRHWTVDQDGTAVHLYAQGGIAELPFTAATYTSTAVQLRFGLTLVAGGEFNAPDWRVEGGPAVTRVDDSNSSDDGLKLMLAAPPAAGVLDVRYTGVDVTSSAGDPIKFSRLLIGTDAVEELDGSAFTGNQALFANGGGDVMTGGSGSDQFFAGSGNDTMTGGRGADTFSWGRRSTGSDSITDFSLAEGDRIDLRSLGLPRGFSRHAAGTALELTQASADSTDAVLKVDLGNTGQFAAPDLTITITNGWTEAGGMMLGLQTLVNQEVIRV